MSSAPITLNDCTVDNIPPFNFDGQEFQAKCIKVYDGDTITVAMKILNKFYKFNIRMLGYDAPELKSKRDEERARARKARDFLTELVLNKIIFIRCGKFDKYGRILGTVLCKPSVAIAGEIIYIGTGTKNINELMCEQDFCRPYTGGHRDEWNDM
jgi:endonuclease YncB( thermonuclease family)